jgi:prepilin-type N-terminal cleavage/methylation domain-containing protein
MVGIVKNILKSSDQRGFSLIEIISVLVVLGITAFIVIARLIGTADIDRSVQDTVIKNHIRFAQSAAMKRGDIWGIKCDGADYWLFRNNNPDASTNQVILPGEENLKVSLAGKKITMSAFTVFFDSYGKPYTAYTDATTNAPVVTALSIAINSIPAGVASTLILTPETGFIP